MQTHMFYSLPPLAFDMDGVEQVGVGALVLDATRTKVLAVQEKSGACVRVCVYK